jgi:hypothetical protein
MRRIHFIIILFILINISGQSQVIRYYHKFRTSDSNILLTDWRVDKNDKGEKYIIETVDKEDRVIELRLIDNNKLYKSDCYDVSIIKFEYKGDSIIQFNMINDSVYSTGIECGDVSKIVYIIDNLYIIKSISYIYYDEYLKLDLEPVFRSYLEAENKKNKNGIEDKYNCIWGYQFSSVKYKGTLPIRKGFSFSEDNYYFQYEGKAKESQFAIYNSPQLQNKKKHD